MTESFQDLVPARRIAKMQVLESNPEQAIKRHRRSVHFGFLGFFKIFQAVYARRRMHHLRHHVQNRKNRVLNLAHQLQERSHHTEGYCSIAKPEAAPNKGEQITQPKGRPERKTGKRGKPRTAQHIAFQVLLHVAQATRHPTFAFERTHEHVVFYTLLHLHLDFGFAFTNCKRHVPEFARHQFAEHNRHRRKQQQRPSEPRVKPAHQKECAHQL